MSMSFIHILPGVTVIKGLLKKPVVCISVFKDALDDLLKKPSVF